MASWAITMIIRLRAATRRLDEERDGLLSSWKEGLLATTRAKHEDRGPERRTDARVTWTWSNDTGVRKAGGAAARAGMDRLPRAEAGGGGDGAGAESPVAPDYKELKMQEPCGNHEKG